MPAGDSRKYAASGTVLSMGPNLDGEYVVVVRLETGAKLVRPGDRWVADCAAREDGEAESGHRMPTRQEAINALAERHERQRLLGREAEEKEREHQRTLREMRLRALDALQQVTYLSARSDCTQDHPNGTMVLDPIFAIIRTLLIDPQAQWPELGAGEVIRASRY